MCSLLEKNTVLLLVMLYSSMLVRKTSVYYFYYSTVSRFLRERTACSCKKHHLLSAFKSLSVVFTIHFEAEAQKTFSLSADGKKICPMTLESISELRVMSGVETTKEAVILFLFV